MAAYLYIKQEEDQNGQSICSSTHRLPQLSSVALNEVADLHLKLLLRRLVLLSRLPIQWILKVQQVGE